MSTTTLFDQAQLAEAAYSEFIVNGILTTTKYELISALSTGEGEFSATQAAEFADNWKVVRVGRTRLQCAV